MNRLLLLLSLFVPVISMAQLRVVATGPDIGALVKEVGGGEVTVETLARGSQNLHFLETKPSYMVRVRKADLVVANGLGLEVAWLPQILRGARNPKILPGEKGLLELGAHIEPIEVPHGHVTRSHGDVHPEGNPHWTLDPLRVAQAALILAAQLGELSPEHKDVFKKRAEDLKQRLKAKTQEWRSRIEKTQIKEVITFHRTLNYFLNRFDLQAAGYLEPRPGIPPSAQHILGVIKSAKEKNIQLILVEHFYDPKVAERIAREVSGLKIQSVAAAVEGAPGIKTLEDLYENLVRAFEENS